MEICCFVLGCTGCPSAIWNQCCSICCFILCLCLCALSQLSDYSFNFQLPKLTFPCFCCYKENMKRLHHPLSLVSCKLVDPVNVWTIVLCSLKTAFYCLVPVACARTSLLCSWLWQREPQEFDWGLPALLDLCICRQCLPHKLQSDMLDRIKPQHSIVKDLLTAARLERLVVAKCQLWCPRPVPRDHTGP